MNEKLNDAQGETVEAAVVRRRNMLKRSLVLGVPLLLTLPGKSFANGTGGGSGDTSGNMSGGMSQSDPAKKRGRGRRHRHRQYNSD